MFGGIFALFGFGFLIPVFLLPAFRIIESQSWRQVPCTIVHSEVQSHSGSSRNGGPTYSIKISFKYDFGDIHYVGTRYDFSVGSSSGFAYRQAIVHRLHRGVHTVCYVNPNRPAEAVIDRGVSRDMWFALIPLVFIAVGMWLVIFAVRSAHPKPISTAASAGGRVALVNSARLKEAQSPFAKLIGIGFFALFWNGIVSVFVHEAYFNAHGPVDWFLRIFLIPFLLVGLVTILLWFYQLLALFNPRPHITLTTSAISLGQSCELRWNFTGNFSRISQLTVVVEGQEQATYRRGTNTVTDHSTFARIRIADTTRQMDIGSGRGIFTIPTDAMHSFASRNNKIIWLIKLHGTISGWPDVKTEFPMQVAPQTLKRVLA